MKKDPLFLHLGLNRLSRLNKLSRLSWILLILGLSVTSVIIIYSFELNNYIRRPEAAGLIAILTSLCLFFITNDLFSQLQLSLFENNRQIIVSIILALAGFLFSFKWLSAEGSPLKDYWSQAFDQRNKIIQQQFNLSAQQSNQLFRLVSLYKLPYYERNHKFKQLAERFTQVREKIIALANKSTSIKFSQSRLNLSVKAINQADIKLSITLLNQAAKIEAQQLSPQLPLYKTIDQAKLNSNSQTSQISKESSKEITKKSKANNASKMAIAKNINLTINARQASYHEILADLYSLSNQSELTLVSYLQAIKLLSTNLLMLNQFAKSNQGHKEVKQGIQNIGQNTKYRQNIKKINRRIAKLNWQLAQHYTEYQNHTGQPDWHEQAIKHYLLAQKYYQTQQKNNDELLLLNYQLARAYQNQHSLKNTVPTDNANEIKQSLNASIELLSAVITQLQKARHNNLTNFLVHDSKIALANAYYLRANYNPKFNSKIHPAKEDTDYTESKAIYKKLIKQLSALAITAQKTERLAQISFRLGIIYLETKQYELAIDCFKKALDLQKKHYQAYPNHPELASTWYQLAQAYKGNFLKTGFMPEMLNEAIIALKKAIAIKNNNTAINHFELSHYYSDLAALYFVQKNYAQAINYYQIANQKLSQAQQHPRYLKTRHSLLSGLASAYEKNQQYAQAIVTTKKLMQLTKQHKTDDLATIAKLNYQISLLQLKNKQPDAAHKSACVAIEAEKKVKIKNNESNINCDYKETKATIRQYDLIHRLALAKYYYQYASTLVAQQNDNKAEMYYQVALEYYPQANNKTVLNNFQVEHGLQKGRTYFALGKIYFRQGDYTKAEESYRRAQKIFRSFKQAGIVDNELVNVLQERANAQFNSGQYQDAQKTLKKIWNEFWKTQSRWPNDLAFSSKRAKLWYRIALINELNGNYTQAIKDYDESLKQWPDNLSDKLSRQLLKNAPPEIQIDSLAIQALTHHKLGRLQRFKGKFTDARKHLKTALKNWNKLYEKSKKRKQINLFVFNNGSEKPSHQQDIKNYLKIIANTANYKHAKDELILQVNFSVARQLRRYEYYHPEVATTWQRLGEAWENLDQRQISCFYFETALKIWRNLYINNHITNQHDKDIGEDSFEIAWQQTNRSKQQALLFNDIDKPHSSNEKPHYKSQETYKALLSEQEKVLRDLKTKHKDKKHPKVAQQHCRIGLILQAGGHYNNAIAHYKEAKDIWQNYNNQARIAEVWYKIGYAHTLNHDFDAALWAHEKALQTLKKIYKGNKHPAIVNNQFEISFIMYEIYHRTRKNLSKQEQKKHYNAIITKLEKTIKSARQTYGNESHPIIANINYSLAQIHDESGHSEESIHYYEKTVTSWKQLFNADHPRLIQTKIKLATLLLNNNQFKKAKKVYHEVLSNNNIFDTQKQSIHEKLGHIYHIMGIKEKSDRFYHLALDYKEKELGNTHVSYQHTMKKLSH